MDSKSNKDKIRLLVRQRILKEYSENDYATFNPDEFEGPAKEAAMKDLGSEFTPLGASKFDKHTNADKIKSDLTRQNLDLPSDKKDLEKVKDTLRAKEKHDKIFGNNTMNEDDEHEHHTKSIQVELAVIETMLKPSWLPFKYRYDPKTETAIVEIAGDTFKAWTTEDGIWLEAVGNEHTEEGSNPFPIGDAKTIANEINKRYSILTHMNETEVPTAKLDRPLDSEGQPITPRARVEDLDTKSIGRVLRFGSDENGNLTVHVEWMQQFGAAIPKTITYPDRIVVRDENRIVKEDELEEGIGQSHTIGRGQNVKPGNYPETLRRVGLKENLEQATTIDDEVFLVIDNAFNRAHYKELIGKTFPDSPAYAETKVVRPEEAEKERSIKYDEQPIAEGDFDYAAEEKNYHNTAEHEEATNLLGKQVVVSNMDKIAELLYPNQKRIQSVLQGIKEELEAHRIYNNQIAATDNMDTDWLFEVLGIKGDTINLKFIGTAK